MVYLKPVTCGIFLALHNVDLGQGEEGQRKLLRLNWPDNQCTDLVGIGHQEIINGGDGKE